MKNKKIVVFLTLIVIVILTIVSLIIILNTKTKDVKKTKSIEEKIEDKIEEKSLSRPFAVMINNNQAVWGYQAGIQDAYLTYEIIVEGGITRLMSLFKDTNTSRIASVRSSRHYFLDYVLENDAIYAHIGQSTQAKNDLATLKINKINADNSDAFTWDSSLKLAREHTAYTTMEKLKDTAKKKKYRTTINKDDLLNISDTIIDISNKENVVKAENILIPFSNSYRISYKYDATKKVYMRYQNNNPHKDFVSKEQYSTKNIITYQVKNYNLNDGSGKNRQGLDNIGHGEGFYITEGYAIPITWEKTSRKNQTVYKEKASGEILKINKGNTFIEIQPSNKKLTIQ